MTNTKTTRTSVRKAARTVGTPGATDSHAVVTTSQVAPAGPRKRASPRLPQTVRGAVRAAIDKKAEDVVVLDLRKTAGFTDYFVICTGANARQIAAIADHVRETLKTEYDERPALAEGVDTSEWVLLDYFDFVVHVFSRECRAFYGLERLWGNAERREFRDAGTAGRKHT
jgi:ribosome-associated protein